MDSLEEQTMLELLAVSPVHLPTFFFKAKDDPRAVWVYGKMNRKNLELLNTASIQLPPSLTFWVSMTIVITKEPIYNIILYILYILYLY